MTGQYVTHICGHETPFSGSDWEAREAATAVCWQCYIHGMHRLDAAGRVILTSGCAKAAERVPPRLRPRVGVLGGGVAG